MYMSIRVSVVLTAAALGCESVFSADFLIALVMHHGNRAVAPGAQNQHGEFVFTIGHESIWGGNSQSARKLFDTSTIAPGSGTPFSGFAIGHSALVNNDATVAFLADVDSGSVTGIWTSDLESGPLALVAATGQSAPGTEAGRVFARRPGTKATIAPIELNEPGQILLGSWTNTPSRPDSPKYGLWTGNHLGLELLALEGNQAAGMPEGVTYSSLLAGNGNSSMDTAGNITFRAFLSGPGIDQDNEFGIFWGASGNVRRLLRPGEPAPGMPTGLVIGPSRFGYQQLLTNSSGQLFGTTAVAGAGIDSTNDQVIFAGDPQHMHPVVREGELAPGTEPNTRFFGTLQVLGANKQGEFVMRSDLVGPSVTPDAMTGLWFGDNDSLRLLARAGMPAPGVPGTYFRSFGQVSGPNSYGQVAFNAELSGPNVSFSNNAGIWMTDLDGELSLVVRKDNMLPLTDGLNGIVRFIADLRGFGGGEGRSNSLSDAGLVFEVSLVDANGNGIGNSVYVARVPEPSTWILVAFVCGLFRWKVAVRRRLQALTDTSRARENPYQPPGAADSLASPPESRPDAVTGMLLQVGGRVGRLRPRFGRGQAIVGLAIGAL
jgi:hypothetical protein